MYKPIEELAHVRVEPQKKEVDNKAACTMVELRTLIIADNGD